MTNLLKERLNAIGEKLKGNRLQIEEMEQEIERLSGCNKEAWEAVCERDMRIVQLERALLNVLSWWPEGFEVEVESQDASLQGFADDIQAARAVIGKVVT